jgi:15-cis-phytoene synthase
MATREISAEFPLYTIAPTHTPVATRNDYAICRTVMRAASKNYSFASRFFPAEKLHHVEALYAFLRVGDDRVDVSHNGFSSPEAAIDDWERLYWHAFETGSSPDPVIRAYVNTAIEHDLPANIMVPYFNAMREDLKITRFPRFEDLLHYMAGSAIPVGRAMTYILGTRDPYSTADALPGADALSIAMQLSNFWRDIGDDYHRIDRIYIPEEDMDRFGVTESVLNEKQVTSEFIALLEWEFDRTETYYKTARKAVAMLDGGRWGVMSGLEIYRAILTDIRRNNYDVFNRRAGASDVQKLGLTLKARLAVL